MLHTHTDQGSGGDTGNTTRHILYLHLHDVSMLNMHVHTHAHTEAAACLFCSFAALTQLQFAVRQNSQGWSKKCQHILLLTFLLLCSPLRLLAFILNWSSLLNKQQSCWAIYQHSSAATQSTLVSMPQQSKAIFFFFLIVCTICQDSSVMWFTKDVWFICFLSAVTA